MTVSFGGLIAVLLVYLLPDFALVHHGDDLVDFQCDVFDIPISLFLVPACELFKFWFDGA
jgi:hypothetical protein